MEKKIRNPFRWWVFILFLVFKEVNKVEERKNLTVTPLGKFLKSSLDSKYFLTSKTSAKEYSRENQTKHWNGVLFQKENKKLFPWSFFG